MTNQTKWVRVPGPTDEDKLTSAFAQMVTAPTMREFYEARKEADTITAVAQLDAETVKECKADAWELLMPEWYDYSQEELIDLLGNE